LTKPNNDDHLQTRAAWDSPEEEVLVFLQSSAFDFYLALANEARTTFDNDDLDADLMALLFLRQKYKGAELKRKFVVISAKELRNFLGDHYDGGVLTTECPNEIEPGIYCGTEVNDMMDRCPECEIPLVWKESRAWSNLYGSPDQAIRDHNLIGARDMLDKRVLTVFGMAGFANPVEYDRWTTIKQRSTPTEIETTLLRISKQHRGRAGWLHFLNACKREVKIELSDDADLDEIEGTIKV
jgi:hypothetical protein